MVLFAMGLHIYIFSGVNREVVEAEKPRASATSNVQLGRFRFAYAVGDYKTTMGQKQVRFPSLENRIVVEKTEKNPIAQKPVEARIAEKPVNSRMVHKPKESSIVENPSQNLNVAKQRTAAVKKPDRSPIDGKWIRNSPDQTNQPISHGNRFFELEF